MQTVELEKKEYVSPSITTLGSLADKTQTFFKKPGPGDQLFLTDNCIDSHLYNNCENSSA